MAQTMAMIECQSDLAALAGDSRVLFLLCLMGCKLLTILPVDHCFKLPKAEPQQWFI